MCAFQRWLSAKRYIQNDVSANMSPSTSTWRSFVIAMIIASLVFCLFTLDVLNFRREYANVTSHENVNIDDNSGEKDDIFRGKRLREYQRRGIVVPDRSIDSRECDDFSNLTTCNVTDGYVSCFDCVESRHSLRVCIHLSEDLTIRDDESNHSYLLPANIEPSQGYCLRESVARDIRNINGSVSNAIKAAKRECNIYNADWILVRRRVDIDSSYNFVCRCKYPHLMINNAGPMSACSRDVACNGHGRLDDASHNSRSDPFVDGRCMCEDGYISEYTDKGGLGPYCREATFAEWPSAFYGTKQKSDDIELYAQEIDKSFRRSLTFSRKDDPDAEVWLPNPCSPCPIKRATDGSYFCADDVEIESRSTGEGTIVRHISRVYIGVRRERDYLTGNGGRLPNACVSLYENELASTTQILVQYMSQMWNNGSQFAQEIGFFVSNDTANNLLFDAYASDAYVRFRSDLTAPDNKSAFPIDWAVIWTYTDETMREHRRDFCEKLQSTFLNLTFRTDLSYPGGVPGGAWNDFPWYVLDITNRYYLLHREEIEKRGFNVQPIYDCPDRRGLDLHGDLIDVSTETDQFTAQRLGYSMAPVCFVQHRDKDGYCVGRPEINPQHDNPTGCILFTISPKHFAVYARALWYPSEMKMNRFAESRSVGLRDKKTDCND